MQLPGLTIGLQGIDDACRQELLTRLGSYAGAAGPETLRAADLVFTVATADRDYFIEPPGPGMVEYNPLFIELDAPDAALAHANVRACTYSLAASFSTAGGAGRAFFGNGEFEPRQRAVENILRVATAWLAASRGGALMHSASIVKEGRAYLFFGQSGAGKSTISALSRRGEVVSDDLTLILPDAHGHPEVVGAPFRGTYAGGLPVHGRFPVAAAFRLRKAAASEAPAVLPLALPLAMAGAIANLPFVCDQLHAVPELFTSIEGLFGAFPIRVLRFTDRDDSFWEAIEAAGL